MKNLIESQAPAGSFCLLTHFLLGFASITMPFNL